MAKVLKVDFTRKHQKKDRHALSDHPVPAYKLRVTVAFSDPLIWRTIRVPGKMTLATLHQVIQACMGWDDDDTHRFLVGKIFYQSGLGSEDNERKQVYDENNFELHELEEGMQFLFTYLYDGGEGWELEISLEEIISEGIGSGSPCLVDGERACPPADVGDIHQYQALLYDTEGAGDRDRLKFMLPFASDFEPDHLDLEEIIVRLAAIA